MDIEGNIGEFELERILIIISCSLEHIEKRGARIAVTHHLDLDQPVFPSSLALAKAASASFV